jgi:hypothetical protein
VSDDFFEQAWKLGGIPVVKSDFLPEGTVYLVDPSKLYADAKRCEISHGEADYGFEIRRHLDFRRYPDTLTRPKRWRDRMREGWRLYKQSCREGARGFDMHEPNPAWWRKQADVTLLRACCMILGHRPIRYHHDRATCETCGASRTQPTSVLKITGLT